MKKLIAILSLSLFSSIVGAKETVFWTAVFDDIEPRSDEISKQWCIEHTPTVMVTTVDQVLSAKGVKSLNNLNVKYLNYKSEKKDGLLFNTVNAVISGKGKDGDWSEPIKMYQQTLSESDKGKTWVIWSTPKCKGSFVGVPTVVNTAVKD